VHVICRLIPERGRLRQIVVSDKPLSSNAMWHALQDLQSLCAKDLSVFYYPGLEQWRALAWWKLSAGFEEVSFSASISVLGRRY
jgi:hypothetical protein